MYEQKEHSMVRMEHGEKCYWSGTGGISLYIYLMIPSSKR